MHFADSLLEKWKAAPIPNHIKRLLKETLYAYRRKENGLVVGVLPTLWEGFIREKAAIEKKPSSKELRDAVAKLVEENQSSSTISAFYDTCIMYHCGSPEEAKPDVPGRHAVAHGWFERYPTKKAALNAILSTDFLLRWNQMPDGRRIQRDLYSAFLIQNSNSTLDGFDTQLCNTNYKHFVTLHDEEIQRLNGIKMPSSAGL